MIYTKEIKEVREFDIAVIGGGMGGCAAAVSAARSGANVVLIERGFCLGGTATAGGVNHLLGGSKHLEDGRLVRAVGGIFKEIGDRLIGDKMAIDPFTLDPKHHPHGWLPELAEGIPFDGEYMKLLLEELCLGTGVKLLYGTVTVDAVRRGDVIEAAIVHNKSGLSLIKADCFIDASGDLDLTAAAGVSTLLGREEDGMCAPSTLEMCLEGVDTGALTEYIEEAGEHRFRRLISRLREEGVWRFPYDIMICVQLTRPDVYMINTSRQIGLIPTDGDSVSDYVTDGRRESFELYKVLKEHFPGFANARVRGIAANLGIRESRRLVGKYTLTANDIASGRVFNDGIACSAYGWDMPDPKKPSLQAREGVRKAPFSHIPYSVTLNDEVKNLAVVGKGISAERDALGPIRVMAPVIAVGEAVGIAAAMAARSYGDLGSVNTDELRERIRSVGGICDVPEVAV